MKLYKVLFWAARVLVLLLAAFFAVFALDSLSDPLGLFMHLIPTFIILIMAYLMWRRALVASFVFLGLGILAFFQFNGYKEVMQFLLVALPFFVISALFMGEYYAKKLMK